MKDVTLPDLADDYEVFLLDQFGVLLDGRGPYSGAIEALAALRRCGKQVVILSNSGKRAGPNEARLVRLGFDRADFTTVITSGEAAHRLLAGRIGAAIPAGARVLVLSRDDDLSCIDGLDLTVTTSATEAQLVLIAGSRGEHIPLEEYARQLEGPAQRRVPALCTNPDLTMLTAQGPSFGAGRIAQLYRDLGGTVDEIGKPDPLIYQVADEHLGHPDPASVICIGDSPAHDIRGAHAAGYRAALVRTGVHADESLERVLTDAPDTDRPDFVLPRFEWRSASRQS